MAPQMAPAPQVPTGPQMTPAPSPQFDIPRDLSHAADRFVVTPLPSNGTKAAPPRTAAPTRTTAETTPAPRPLGQRIAFGLAVAVGTVAMVAYFVRGHDVRPSLESSAATTAPTTTVQGTPTASAPATAPASQAPATSAGTVAPTTTAARPGTTPTTSVTSAAKVTPRVVSVFDLVKGNCLDGAGLSDGLVTTIRVVDCSEVHTHEVYYSGRYPETTFDATKISNYANDTCLTQFTSYVGIDYERSRYQYLHIVPTQDSWTRDNDRDVVCVAFDEDGTITGSIAGRKQ